jgi:peptidase M23-like protein
MPPSLQDIFDGDRPVTQRYGEVSRFYALLGLPGCDGVDWGLEAGVSCRAAVTGQVVRAGWGANGLGTAYGNAVEVWDPTQNCLLVWCHLQDIAVSVGQHVTADTLIGHSGASGATENAHLHFMFARTDASGARLDLANGFGGNLDCLDPNVVTWVARSAAPAPPDPVNFTGTVSATRGAPLRSGPGEAMPEVGLTKHGETGTFNGWAAGSDQASTGGATVSDTAPPGQKWLRRTDGKWLRADALDVTVPDAMPPVEWSPPPQPASSSSPPPRHAYMVLAGVGIWEPEAGADYSALAAAGASWVAIRATNGPGLGHAALYERNFQQRAPAAREANLLVLGWTHWHGASEGVAGDVAEYLRQCSDYTAARHFDVAAWIIEADDRHLAGLGHALLALREQTGRPVYVSLPGDPKTRRLSWDWESTIGSIEAVMPRIYTRAWKGSPSPAGSAMAGDGFKDAMVELRAVFGDIAMLPVSDELDPNRAAEWCAAARGKGLAAASLWGWNAANASSVAPYVRAFPPPQPAAAPRAALSPQPPIPPQPVGIGGTTMGGGPVSTPTPPLAPTPGYFAQLTTTGSDGIEPGIFTSEFLVTQVGSLLATALGLAVAFGWINVTADERKQIVQLVIGAIALMESIYTFSRGMRKGLAQH